MKKFISVKDVVENGLYWYWANGMDRPEPVLIDQEKHPGFFRGFNGRRQSWLRDGEYLEGPTPEPVRI